MINEQDTYTYRAGDKVALEKLPDRFVVRASPEEAMLLGVSDVEPVSSGSTLVRTSADQLERLMAEGRALAPVHHAYRLRETGDEFLITDRVFITFGKPPNEEDLGEFAGRYGLVLRERYSDREFLFQLTDRTGMNPVKLVTRLTEDDPLVESADHDLNHRTSISQLPLPADPSYTRQWHLHTRFQHPWFDRRSSARCEEAWQILGHYGTREIVVGVTDDGCKLDHPDFDQDKFASWGYFRGTRLVRREDVDAEADEMYQEGSNHGTSCAGVIAAELDAVLTVGAAPGCRLLPIKWESQGRSLFISDSKLRTALDYIADSVDVLSNSWGHVPVSMYAPLVTSRIAELARNGGRQGRGIVFLWAAGNENCPIQHDSQVDIPYTSGWEPGPGGVPRWVGPLTGRRFHNNLAAVPGVMHVAALASTAQRSHYSNYGTGIRICAPSSNSHAYGRLPLAGLGITTTTGPGNAVTDRFGGTSSATPLVAGIAALVRSANPALTAREVIEILERTASKDLDAGGYPRTPPANYDLNTGWDVSPVPPFDSGRFVERGDPTGTWSPWFGHGRVDAPAAVTEALRLQGGRWEPVRLESRPKRRIPDADPVGVRDSIAVNAPGRVRDLRVSVDITHPWIGDLRVALIGPEGAARLLSDRAGANRDNIRVTYDAASTPALTAFRDRPAAGEWALDVKDLARGDVGVLNAWALELDLAPAPVVREDVASARIPDDDPRGVERTLDFPPNTPIADLVVSVDVTHPYVGDLRMVLTPPAGDPVVLHDRAGGGADNLLRNWRARDIAALRGLRGRDAAGIWRLVVADVARRDEGKLNRWAVEVSRG